MMKSTLRVLVAGAILAATACNRTNKTDQLAALENAYQSGLLTKKEYEAKKLALIGAPPSAPAPVPKVAEAPTQPEPVPRPAVPDKPVKPSPAPKLAATQEPSPPSPMPEKSAKSSPAPKVGGAQQSTPNPGTTCDDEGARSGGQGGAHDRVYNASPERVRRAAAAALSGLDFDIQKNSTIQIEAKKRRHIGALVGAGGERVILTFERSQRGTRVTGETKKSFIGRVAQRNWTDAVLAQIACKLRE